MEDAGGVRKKQKQLTPAELKRKLSNRVATRNLRARRKVRRARQIVQIKQLQQIGEAQNTVVRAIIEMQRELISALPPTVEASLHSALLQSTRSLEDALLSSSITESLYAGLDKLCCTPTIIRKKPESSAQYDSNV